MVATSRITIADEVWVSTALLHRDHPDRADFTVAEIRDRVLREGLAGELRAGVETHIREHCVANRPRDPNRARLLYATDTGRRRLFREGDEYHPGRAGGRVMPLRDNVPADYRYLLDWYAADYSPRSSVDPLLQ